ncbi:uncharacterized protein CTRU02_206153 [Colletotrichum truncatum]|uniref:Uncharacterized protein n=1 Tax=Colletotrichum truncatum TaxID=5467 RepID=A0ACC3Z632_COLTU|nr:uncharacterized protein CTRU02_10429 [Colletotrichum truncatum]KAF6787166.1 hypothetical protein CTRU02_10429 [Colletotrichum truncatum]
MAGGSDRYRDVGFRGGEHTPKKRTENSYMWARSSAMVSGSPKTPGSRAATPATQAHRPAVAANMSTPPAARATPVNVLSRRASQKFPVALNSPVTTPSKHLSSAPRSAFEPSPGTMSSRKLDGVHSLSAMLEKQDQEPVSQSRSKFSRSTQSKAKNEKFDPHAVDSDDDESSSSSSDSSDSDDEQEKVPSFLAKPNGIVSSSKAAGTPVKKAKRGKEDEVADSDVERRASISKANSAKKKTPVKPESSSEESTSESESSDSESESKKKPAQQVNKKAAVSAGASSTSTSDSESDSESEAENEKEVEAKAASTSSSEATSSEEESSSSEEEESGSEKGSNSDEEESESDVEESAAIVEKRNSNKLSVPGFVGKDFVLRQAQGDEDGKDMADFFTKAKLDGKQLWYFTAPASMPINVIEKVEIPMDKAKKGDAIFKHNSEDYTVGFEGEASTSIQLLIPNKKGTRYESASQKVENVFHIKRVTQLPGGDPRVNTRALTNEQNAARPQPAGLKARFRPIGVTNDTPMGSIGADTEDVEMTAAPIAPSSSKKSKRAAAQSQDSMDIDEPTPKSSKKDKKGVVATPKASKRKHASDEVSSAQSQKEALSTEKKAKKVKTDADSTEASAKKQTAILPPTVPKAGFTFTDLPTRSSPAVETSTPKASKSKSSKKSKETPIQPPSVRRESAVPLPPSALKQTSPAAAEETPKQEKRKRRKSDKKETPIPAPKY